MLCSCGPLGSLGSFARSSRSYVLALGMSGFVWVRLVLPGEHW